MRCLRFNALSALVLPAAIAALVWISGTSLAHAQRPDKPPVEILIEPDQEINSPPGAAQDAEPGIERKVLREIQEEELEKSAEALGQHLEKELEELRKYLGDMVDRQDELAELVKKLVESGQAVAGDVAREAMEKAKQELAEQQKNMAEMKLQAEEKARQLAIEAEVKAQEMLRKAEEARQRELEKQQEPVSRVIRVEHADPEQVLSVLSPLFDVQIASGPDARVLGVRGPAHMVDAFEEALKRLDEPPAPVRNIELRVHLLAAAKTPANLPELSPDMVEVIEALQPVFPYEDWGLLETTFVRCRDGESARLAGEFDGTGDGLAHYKFEIQVDRVHFDAASDGIALDAMDMDLYGERPLGPPGGAESQYANIAVDIDLKNGQRAVVGKASMPGGFDAIFLVVTATVL